MAGYIGSKAVNLSTTGADIAGDADVSGALDVGGAFTSQGIDDNATSTAMTLDGSGNVGVGAVPLTSGNIPDLTIAHTGHGLGLGYQGATLPTAAGMYTSNSTNFGQAYGSLVVQSRTDYSGYSITFRNNGGERMRIDSAGRVTTPYQPSFRATNSTTAAANIGTVVFSDTSGSHKHNIGGHYSTSTGRFTAPVSGVYFFSSHILWEGVSNTDDGIHHNLYLNSTLIHSAGRLVGETANGNYGYGGYVETQLATSVYMSANDYVVVKWSGTGAIKPHNSSSWCSFNGYLIG
jgi:hypothetical protein